MKTRREKENNKDRVNIHYDDDKKQWVSDLVEKTNVIKMHVKKSNNEDIKVNK